MSLDSRVSLVVASLDLQLTRLLRQAIRSADVSSGRGQPATALGPAPTAPPVLGAGASIHPNPEIEPRPRIEPAPRFEPRPIVGLCPCDSRDVNPSLPPPEIPRDPEVPRLVRSPLEPPWKQLPWENPAPLPPKVKVIVKPPDLQKTGTVFDLFA